MSADTELLRRYVDERSEAAFTELVRLHVNLVYFAALRQVGGDAHRAQDVTQTVFTDLARKAASLTGRATLTGWLHTSTRLAAAMVRRSEASRQKLLREAETMQAILQDNDANPEWERLRPTIDEAIHDLNERDREAVLLRFFEGQAFAEIGETFGLSDDAARMRVERALEKLRTKLSRRGITSTTAALGFALAHQATAAVPATLATSVTGMALAAGTSGGGAVGFLTFIGMTKLQTGVAGAVALAAAAGLVTQARSQLKMRDELAALRRENREIVAGQNYNERLARIAAEAAAYRSDHAELVLLRHEIAVLQTSALAAERLKFLGFAAARTPGSRTPFDPTGPDRPPVRLSSAAPAYPFAMRRERINGEVVVEFTVDAEGRVQNPRTVKSSRTEFEAQALAAVSKWRFNPGVKDQQAVSMLQQATVTFALADEKAGIPADWF